MPAPQYFSGILCSTNVNGAVVNCGDWSADLDTKDVDITTGADAGAENCLPGTHKLSFTINGPVNAAPLFLRNQLIAIVLIPGNGAPTITFTGLLTKVAVKQKTDDAYRLVLQGRSAGEITGI